MPGTDGYFSSAHLQASDPARIDDMAERVLAPMIGVGVAQISGTAPYNCVPPNCDDLYYHANASSEEHVALARRAATDGIVLLKNDDNILPIKRGSKVAVLGSACDATNNISEMLAIWDVGNLYVMGGSGRVIPANPVSVLDGLRKREPVQLEIPSAAISISDDVEAAIAALQGVDVAFVCAGTTSTEGNDRANLELDQDSFVSGVLAGAKIAGVPTVALLHTPGAVLTEWRDNATAIATMFLGGQTTGDAWAEVLTGDVSPSGESPHRTPPIYLSIYRSIYLSIYLYISFPLSDLSICLSFFLSFFLFLGGGRVFRQAPCDLPTRKQPGRAAVHR